MAGNRRTRGRKRGLVVQPRDVALLRELGTLRVADREQLAAAGGFHSVTRINARLLALVRAGLLRRFFIGSEGGRKALYALSAKGAQLVGVPMRGPRRRQDELLVADFSVLHQLAINRVYCTLKFGTIPVPQVRFVQWLTFTEPLTPELRLIPDGYVEFQTPTGIDASYIEVDLGTEPQSVWKEKATRYVRLAISGDYARLFKQSRFRVLVIANSPRRVQAIRKTVATITAKIFWFASLDEIRGEQFFAPVWLRAQGDTPQALFAQPHADKKASVQP